MCSLDPRLASGHIGWVGHDGHETPAGVGGFAGAGSNPAQMLGPFLGKAAAIRVRDGVLSYPAVFTAAAKERRGGCIPTGGMLRAPADSWWATRLEFPYPLPPVDRTHVFVSRRWPPRRSSPTRCAPNRVGWQLLGRLLPPAVQNAHAHAPHSDPLDDPRLLEAVCLSLRFFPALSIARSVLFGVKSFPGEPGDGWATPIGVELDSRLVAAPDESALTGRLESSHFCGYGAVWFV